MKYALYLQLFHTDRISNFVSETGKEKEVKKVFDGMVTFVVNTLLISKHFYIFLDFCHT